MERGFLPEFSSEVLAELGQAQNLATAAGVSLTLQNKRDLLWASIDNDDSLDLDQLTVAQPLLAASGYPSIDPPCGTHTQKMGADC